MVEARHLEATTTNAGITGAYRSGGEMTLATSNGAIDADVWLANNEDEPSANSTISKLELKSTNS